MSRMSKRRRARLEALARYRSVFDDPAVPAGTWHQPDAAPSSFATATFELHPEAARFVRDCRAYGWMLDGFDWATRAQTPEAQRLRDEPAALARASEHQLAQLLTVVIRQDRFADGALSAAFEGGLIGGILRRAEALGEAVGRGNR